MRMRQKPWAGAEFAQNTLLIPAQDAPMYKGRLRECFGGGFAASPLYLEIGCGKGGFITRLAFANPGACYIAIERERMVIVSAMRKAREAGVCNLRFILADADMLPELFAPCELAGLYLNFPDPWHRKKKWHKKRLTHSRYLQIYNQILAPGASVFFKTDNADLFNYSIETFFEAGYEVKQTPDSVDNIITEYERRFMDMGLPIYRLQAVRG